MDLGGPSLRSYREEGLRFFAVKYTNKPDPHTIIKAERERETSLETMMTYGVNLNRAVEYDAAAAASYRTDPVFMEPINLRSTVCRFVYVHNNLPHDSCFHLQTLILKTKVRLRSQILFFFLFLFPIISFGDGWMNRAKSTFLSTAQSLVTSSHHVFIILYIPLMPSNVISNYACTIHPIPFVILFSF